MSVPPSNPNTESHLAEKLIGGERRPGQQKQPYIQIAKYLGSEQKHERCGMKSLEQRYEAELRGEDDRECK